MVKIEVLGSGCAKCHRLEELARAAVVKLGIDAEIDHVTDIKEIMSRGVISTPGLAVDGKIVSAGRLPSEKDVESLISQAVS